MVYVGLKAKKVSDLNLQECMPCVSMHVSSIKTSDFSNKLSFFFLLPLSVTHCCFEDYSLFY